MTTQTLGTDARIPDDIAAAAVLPASYRDEENITYPAFAWLRRNNPFGQAHVEGYAPIWLATTQADIIAIERDPATFTSGRDEPMINDSASNAFLQLMRGDARTLDTLAYMDAPEHTKIKNVTSSWFLPASIRKREDDIRVLARSAVEHLMSFDGECDIVQDFALRYPLRVIMSLFGVPREDEELMLKLTQELFGTTDPDEQRSDVALEPDVAARMWRAAIADFSAYFNELSAARRREPTDDLASLIANAKVDGEYLTESFVNGYYIAIATAGHDTTSSTVAGAIQALARFPEQLEAVRSDLGLVSSLVDEAVRWVSPVKHFHRIVGHDTEFAGRELREGDSVMLLYPSANRDEAVFENPSVFDVTRRPNKHLAFGFGPHMCIGQHVAKLEMRILFEELLPRVTSFELAGPAKYVAANFLSGVKTQPIAFTKA
ncbi:MAG TPA: cytochrome P450 [Pseudonocardia sp.]|nr:cytochrome P450 [Pseudonocardia sp.]